MGRGVPAFPLLLPLLHLLPLPLSVSPPHTEGSPHNTCSQEFDRPRVSLNNYLAWFFFCSCSSSSHFSFCSSSSSLLTYPLPQAVQWCLLQTRKCSGQDQEVPGRFVEEEVTGDGGSLTDLPPLQPWSSLATQSPLQWGQVSGNWSSDWL